MDDVTALMTDMPRRNVTNTPSPDKHDDARLDVGMLLILRRTAEGGFKQLRGIIRCWKTAPGLVPFGKGLFWLDSGRFMACI